jgi:predicted RNA-binding protein with PIN domain
MDEPAQQRSGRTVVVDGNNVIGSVADGWWRDRPAAVRRLLARLQCHARRTGDTVILVLDVPQADLPAGVHDGVEVGYPTRRGRDAADERIVDLLATRDLAGDEGDGAGVEVVTSDRALATAARATRARPRLTGARTFLDRLDDAGC